MKKRLIVALTLALALVCVFALTACPPQPFDLDAYKTEAKATLGNYAQQSDYEPANWTSVLAEVSAGNTAIDAATDKDGVDAAVTAAKAEIDKIAKKQPVVNDPNLTDGTTFNVSKLYSTADLPLADHVKELKTVTDGYEVTTEVEIAEDAKMTLVVTFKDGKFDTVEMTIDGENAETYEEALEVEVSETITKSNDPTLVEGQNIRLPRSLRSGNNNQVANPFDFDTIPASGEPNDHQLVGEAAFECLEFAVAAYRFVLAAKNVFGSYANYLEAEEVEVEEWEFDGDIVGTAMGNPTVNIPVVAAVRIEKVLEFPKSWIVFATCEALITSGNPQGHGQLITVMVRIDKVTHKVLEADYAYFHVSEYQTNAGLYTKSLTDAAAFVKNADVTNDVYVGKDGTDFDLQGVSSATLTNSTLVNAFNAAFAYYNDVLNA
ncbi:MAG: hypothetical protein FWE84_01115 [Firmicutes bacterium]|nr:hypothetical protein [Bacillota bacterium]